MAENDKVLVDTSVWIDFLRGEESVVNNLGILINRSRITICGQIRQEVLQGSRDEKAFSKLEQEMSIWEYGSEEPTDFIEAARVFSKRAGTMAREVGIGGSCIGYRGHRARA